MNESTKQLASMEMSRQEIGKAEGELYATKDGREDMVLIQNEQEETLDNRKLKGLMKTID